MNKDKQSLSLEDDKLTSSASDLVSPKSTLIPPTQPLPKKVSGSNISTDPKNTKDSDPTQ